MRSSITFSTTSSTVMFRRSVVSGSCFATSAVFTYAVLTVNARMLPGPSAAMDCVRPRSPNFVVLYAT
nr:hypothetical protein [Halorubellus sp. JP-L1]